MENKDKLKIKINEFIDAIIDKADEDDKLYYFHIEISSHNGNLQMEYRLRDRKRFIKVDNIIYATYLLKSEIRIMFFEN